MPDEHPAPMSSVTTQTDPLPYVAATLTQTGIPLHIFETGALHWSLERLCRAIDATGTAAHRLPRPVAAA
jgi:hypothetical protein